MYINLRDLIIQIILIIMVNVAALLAVEITIYRVKRTASSPENRPRQGWREKLGIETTKDLLIFCIITGVACSILTMLALQVLDTLYPYHIR